MSLFSHFLSYFAFFGAQGPVAGFHDHNSSVSSAKQEANLRNSGDLSAPKSRIAVR